jgi:acetyl esterase/lipase
MLQQIKRRIFQLLQAFKVWGFRKYYHIISARGWKGHIGEPTYNALQIPGEVGPIRARMYPGSQTKDRPLIVYFHGGGWVIGDLHTHHPFCHTLSLKSGCTVIAVDYRLAPEHPFPAAPDDCLAATRWIADHIGDFGPSNHRLLIAGDSAGGNLAICTCLELGPEIRAMVAGQVVKYPAVDHYSSMHASYIERARGQSLTSKVMFWFWDTYLADCAADDPKARRAMPLQADTLPGLPPTFLITAEYDPLRDEGIAFADKLREAGVALHYRHFDTALHGFACSEGPTPDFNAYMEDLVSWIDQLE